MYQKFILSIVIIILITIGGFTLKKINDKATIESDRLLLYSLANELGYSSDQAVFSHNKTDWTNIESNHDIMKLFIKSEETSASIEENLQSKNINFALPKDIYNKPIPNFWIIGYKDKPITINLTPEVNAGFYLREPIISKTPIYLEISYDREETVNDLNQTWNTSL